MNKEVESVREELIFKFGYLTNKIGLSKSMGQLYAALYFSKKPISLDELGVICRMSKGNASINIRRLEKWGAVKRVWVKENRKDHYEANREIMSFVINHSAEIFSGFLQEGNGLLDEVKIKMDSLEKKDLDAAQKEALVTYKANLRELEGLMKKIAGLMKNIHSLRGLIGI
ncbi:GbsR/MarR family transcriptional regulator [Candidatus Omnitrophota bacterium]